MGSIRLPGDLIRHYRIKAGLTQEALGILAGFSKATAGVRIAQYESGSRNTKAEIAGRIAAALNISIEKITITAENERRLIAIGKIAEEHFDCDGIAPREFAAMLRENGGAYGF
ncbi:helix-turn-helix domain-containing protein [Oscillospiraceae bacterium OttesenSCG-928-G22]|nr:helix-turn-helix domain-containing protein [Oscillospiraceae bacterium OttesenSCG-928-G22]